MGKPWLPMMAMMTHGYEDYNGHVAIITNISMIMVISVMSIKFELKTKF